jgi:hypothetical protein
VLWKSARSEGRAGNRPTGPLKIATVGGDLRPQRLREVSIGNVGGDVLAQRGAPASCGWSEGDARLEKIEGQVRLGSIGGDLRVIGLEGSLEGQVGGDARESGDHARSRSSCKPAEISTAELGRARRCTPSWRRGVMRVE